MARKFNGTSDVATITVDLSGQSRVMVSAWLWRTGTSGIIFEYGASLGFDVVANGANDQIRSYGAASQWSDQYPRPSLNAWHHHLWIFNATNPGQFNRVIIDGIDTGLSAFGGHGPESYTWASSSLLIAGRAASAFCSCRFAEVALWNGVASSSVGHGAPEQTGLGLTAGFVPIHTFTFPTIYVPMLGDTPEPDYGGGRHSAVLTGTTIVNHPATRSLLMAGAS